MNEAFDDEEFEPVEQRHDTELTLGSTTLLTLFFGLVVVCGLCFGLGYAVGHHGTPELSAASLPPAGNQQSGGGDALRGKPSAAPQPKAPPPARAVINLPTPTAAGTSPASRRGCRTFGWRICGEACFAAAGERPSGAAGDRPDACPDGPDCRCRQCGRRPGAGQRVAQAQLCGDGPPGGIGQHDPCADRSVCKPG